MKEKNYEIKRIYYLLLGIRDTMKGNDTSIRRNVVNQINSYMDELSELLNESFDYYKISDYESFGDNTYNPYLCLYQLNPVISYLENMHINSSDYQISKVGYLYNSIEDKELHDRCGDILLGEIAFDRAINQATQILEDRIKKKANLQNTNLIGSSLVSKAIHSKLEQTILKFSDNPEIQEGFSAIFKGVISVYRNPTHHSLNFKCDREYALKFCAYIDELLKELDRSEVVS